MENDFLSIFAVTLPAVLVGFGGHTNWRCKLLVSGGVTRGRVARGAMGDDATKGHDVPSASAETTQSGTENRDRNREGGLSPSRRTN